MIRLDSIHDNGSSLHLTPLYDLSSDSWGDQESPRPLKKRKQVGQKINFAPEALLNFSLHDLAAESWEDLLIVFKQCTGTLLNLNAQLIEQKFNSLPESFRYKIYAQICLELGDYKIAPKLKRFGINSVGELSCLSLAIQRVVNNVFDQLSEDDQSFVSREWQSHLEKDGFHQGASILNAHTEVLIDRFSAIEPFIISFEGLEEI